MKETSMEWHQVQEDHRKEEKPTLKKKILSRLAKYFGGSYNAKENIFVPDAEDEGFMKAWKNTFSLPRTLDNERLAKIYDAMDNVGSEVSLALDTYADEILSTGFVDKPLSIEMKNKTVWAKIESTLQNSKFYEHLWSYARMLAKYGDVPIYLNHQPLNFC